MDYGEAVSDFESFFSERYFQEVAEAVRDGKDSVVVEFEKLDIFSPELTDYLRENPVSAVDAADEGIQSHEQITEEDFSVRFVGMPDEDKILLKNLRSEHIGKFIPVEGMIKRASQVKPEVISAIFECTQCGDRYEKEQDSSELKSPYKCDCGSKKFESIEKVMTDTQIVTLEEDPESREGSEQPSSLSVRLEGDLVDPDFQKKIVPGNVVEVTGVMRERPLKKKSKKFDIYMEANHVEPTQQEFEQLELDSEEVDEIKEMAEDPDIFDRIINSIAPSIFGHERIKEAIALQMFGGVKKTREDGVKSRGDLHILLIGEPGTGKCVAPDTKIIKSNGKMQEIGNLIDEKIEASNQVKQVEDGVFVEEEIQTFGIDNSNNIEEKNSSKLWKREAPEKMIKINSSSGREIEVTPSHPLFVQRNGRLTPIEAKNLNEDDFIAAPRDLEWRGDNTLDIDYRSSKTNNAVRISPPEKLNPDFSRLLGYTAAEGYIQDSTDNSSTIYFTNKNEELLEDFEEQLEKLDANCTRRLPNEEKDAKEIYCSSSELVSLLENIAPSLLKPSRERRMPETVFSASKENTKNFMKAFIEAEGTVSKTQREICVGSTSKELLEEIQTGLLRFNLRSQLKPGEDSYRLRISGKDFEKYIEKIGFITERKIQSSQAFESENNTNKDIIPDIGVELKETRKNLGMTQFDFSIGKGSYQHYERQQRNPSREKIQQISEDFQKRRQQLQEMEEELNQANWNLIKQARNELGLSRQEVAENTSSTPLLIGKHERKERKTQNDQLIKETQKSLQKNIQQRLAETKAQVTKIEELANSDIFWSRIQSIEKIKPEYNHVYDLEIPENHNYITDNIISHNSQLLKFSGELAPKGRYVVGKSSTGAGLCVTGDTLVHTGGGFERIDSVVETDIGFSVDAETAVEYGGELYSYSEEGIAKRKGSSKWRMPEKHCRKLKTSFGKELEASKNTDILVAGEKGIEWKKITEINAGDFVAAPDYSNVERNNPGIMDFFEFEKEKLKLSDDSIKKIRNRMKEEYGSLRNAADEIELSESFVYTSLQKRYIPFKRLELILDDLELNLDELEVERAMLRNSSDFKIPDSFNSDLMYLIGLSFGDGEIQLDEDRAQLRISNSNKEALRKAQNIIKKNFDKEVRIEHQDEKVPMVKVSLKTVAKFMENLGMQSPKKSLELHPELTVAENTESFLRGLMDADGAVVDRDNGSHSVQISTISPTLGRQIQLMFETYGIKAKKRTRDRGGIHERDDGQKIKSRSIQTHIVVIGENIEKYRDEIGFSMTEKEKSLEKISGKNRNSIDNTFPISHILRKSEAKTGNYWTYFNADKNLGHTKTEQILKEVELEEEIREEVEEIASSDLKWEKVTGTEKTGRKELYDLTVEDSHNFIGNGIITHNTASVVKEESTGEFSLEAGAVVLANKGMAAIDEIDKMAAEDRSSLHEAMEQQQISVSKANIQATLNAETSILAAGNPKLGRFDPYEPIPQQISIGDTLLSRFDFIFPVLDEPDESKDKELADTILQNHIDPEETDAEIAQDQLRRYIAYAKKNVRPQLTEEASEKIQEFYVNMRSKGKEGSVPITARQLEALIRIAEASARAHLREEVHLDDAERAIDLLTYCLKQVGMDPETGDFDIDIIESGVSNSQRNRLQTIKQLIDQLAEDDDSAEIEEVLEKAEEEGMEKDQAEEIIERLKREGELFEPEQGHVQKI